MNYPTVINHSHAIELIKKESSVYQIDSEVIQLSDAVGRIVSQSILAPNNLPELNCSRMDGYAINLARIAQKASGDMSFRCVVGKAIHAKAQNDFVRCDNKAIPIMTGAILPVDCDAIVIKENVQHDGECIIFEQLPIHGKYIREAGSDLQKGQLVVSAKQVLTAAHLGMLSSLGIFEVVVSKRPVVGLMLTGDEIIQPGQTCLPGQFYDANSLMLKQMLIDSGCEVKVFPTIQDDVNQVIKTLDSAEITDCDLVISVGGVSMGDKDWIPQVIQNIGEIIFHKVKVRPGFPVLFGKLKQTLFFGLPGNPVSAFTTLSQYGLTAVRYFNGITTQKQNWHARIQHDWRKSHERREYLRGFYEVSDKGQLHVKVCGKQHSSRIESLSDANCFIELNEASQEIMRGDSVNIQPFQHFKTS